jgi:type II secretory pathway pseudopilin PulG
MDNQPTPSDNSGLIHPDPAGLPDDNPTIEEPSATQPFVTQPQAPVQPQPQPMVNQGAPMPVNNAPHNGVNAVDLVWQWVTYGMWEWTLISLATLLITTLNYYFNNSSGSTDYSFTIYILATMLCLLPLAFIANLIYSKREVNPKHGFSAVLMVLNAVIVFLAAVAGLITFVVSVLSLFTSAEPSTTTNIVIVSSLIVLVLNAMLFIRIINPAPLAWFSKAFPYIVIAVAGLAVVVAVVGPFKSQVSNRQDGLIESNLNTVNEDIQTYVNDNSMLPTSLSQLDFSGDQGAQQLVTSNLVSYQTTGTADVSKPTGTNTSTSNANGTFTTTPDTVQSSVLTYKLCVTFKSVKGSPTAASQSFSSSTNQTTLLDEVEFSHPAGRQCYNLTATSS